MKCGLWRKKGVGEIVDLAMRLALGIASLDTVAGNGTREAQCHRLDGAMAHHFSVRVAQLYERYLYSLCSILKKRVVKYLTLGTLASHN